jgi:hypothetical protein
MVRSAGGRLYAMTAELWLPPLVKALATGLLVVSASALAESLGPFWGALIASLPVSAGPAYVFLAMQHGADFVAASALSSFAVNAATGLFLIVYGLLAQRLSPWRGLMTAVLAWLAASLAMHQVTWVPSTALLLNLVVYGVGFGLLKAARGTEAKSEPVARRRRFGRRIRVGGCRGQFDTRSQRNRDRGRVSNQPHQSDRYRAATNRQPGIVVAGGQCAPFDAGVRHDAVDPASRHPSVGNGDGVDHGAAGVGILVGRYASAAETTAARIVTRRNEARDAPTSSDGLIRCVSMRGRDSRCWVPVGPVLSTIPRMCRVEPETGSGSYRKAGFPNRCG